MNKQATIALVLAGLALVLAVAPFFFGGGELGTTNFDDLTLSGDLRVGDDLTVVDDLAVTGDTTFTGNVTGVISNDLNGAAIVLDPGGSSKIQATANFQAIITLGGTPTAAALKVVDSAGTPAAVIRGNGAAILGPPVAFSTGSPITAVTGTVIAPSAVLQPVSIATAGTVPLTIPGAGQYVCFWNTGSQALTVADTGNQILAGNFAMGQYDVLCGFSDGTRFIERSRSNN